MAVADYRYDPFLGAYNIRAISGETHVIPSKSPFTVRLNEVPQKTEPSSLIVKFNTGVVLTEVAAQPAQGQFWSDYNTKEGSDWNTGTLLFNAADAGKIIVVNYNGMGSLLDDRLIDMLEIPINSSTQPEREAIVDGVTSYDSTITSGGGNTYYYRGRLRTHKGVKAGTYTLRGIIQALVNLSHTQEYTHELVYKNCNCDCSDDM